MSFSLEQQTYIDFIGTEDTKLLATAGSGKTFCIIHHIAKLINTHTFDPTNVYVLTFSKNARDDFVLKLKKNGHPKLISRSNIHTIDSFAYKLLQNINVSVDVSILSYTLMRELETLPLDVIHTHYPIVHAMKSIFIDEAQDLNETQYRLLMGLKRTNPNLQLNLVGDPNQNIFQFRKSSDRYLVNHRATTFQLTCNYRSQGRVVEFCSFLRPYNNAQITYAQPKANNLQVTFYSYDNHHAFEHYLLSVLHFMQGRRIPLHKIAILAPTRGYMRDMYGQSKYKGLCYISNLLFKHSIPFQQFYQMGASELNSNEQNTKIEYKPVKDHLNLMTYTSSKGLEWDYVIIVDANAHLITRKDYNEEKYNAERYLLYVACSRPRKNLIIFTKRKYANPWFKNVPEDKYAISRNCLHHFDFYDTSELFKSSEIEAIEQRHWNITTLVSQLSEADLYEINNLIKGTYHIEVNTLDQSPWTVDIALNRQSIVSRFFEHMFHIHLTKTSQDKTMLTIDVENILQESNLLVCDNERIIQWYFKNRLLMTWDKYYDEKLTLPRAITQYIDAFFDHSIPFSSFTLVDIYYDTYIRGVKHDIQDKYNAYLMNPYDLSTVLYLCVVTHAIQTTHYFFVLQQESFYKDVLQEKNVDVLTRLSNVCESINFTVQGQFIKVSRDNIHGIIELIVNEKIGKLIFSKDIQLKDIVTMTLLCDLYRTSQSQIALNQDHPYRFVFYNVLHGTNQEVVINLDSAQLKRLYKLISPPTTTT